MSPQSRAEGVFGTTPPRVDGTKTAIQPVVSTQSFKMQGSINTEHKLGKTIASRRKPLVTFLSRPFGYKFDGQSATALFSPDGMTSGQVDAPSPQAND